MLRNFGVGDWQIFGTIKAKFMNCLFDPMFPAKQNGMAITGIAKGQCRTDYPFFFAFGKDHTLFLCADPVKDDLQSRGGWVKSG